MGWYRRTRFAAQIDSLPCFSSRITNPFQESTFLRPFHQYPKPSFSDFKNLAAQFLRKDPILEHGFLIQNHANPFLQNGAKRFCHIPSRGYTHWFKLSKGDFFRKDPIFNHFNQFLIQNQATPVLQIVTKVFYQVLKYQKYAFVGFVLGSGIVSAFFDLETVPYTNRKHFVLSSDIVNINKGENDLEAKILPQIHPESLRIKLIAKDVIECLEKGVSKGSTGHLEGLNWEVEVVDEPYFLSGVYPGGKIIVSTYVVENFHSEAEIATVIGHEVAHLVARHHEESLPNGLLYLIASLVIFFVIVKFLPFQVARGKGFTKNLLSFIVLTALYLFVYSKVTDLFLRFPDSRRRELEADYIGLLLMASAGYYPRVAPKMWEKLDKLSKEDSGVRGGYFSTHPSCKKRAQYLSQAKIMEEALFIYKEIQAKRRAQLLAQAKL